MGRYLQAATLAIAAAAAVRGAVALTTEGLWAEFAAGVAMWAATGGPMIAWLVGGAWRYAAADGAPPAGAESGPVLAGRIGPAPARPERLAA